ncbi:MAG: right-handed parallel beta-helix repeat-containing protein [Saprospiraceae bacterium]
MKTSALSGWNGLETEVMSFLLAIGLLIFLPFTFPDLNAQMVSVVNSLADDEFAHSYDFQATPLFDESMDGVCEDSLHRCTLRAALEEATNLNQAAHVTFLGSLSGNLTVNEFSGAFAPPDFSIIQGVRQKVIIYGSNFTNSILFVLGNGTAITGLGFANALTGIIVGGELNLVGANIDPVYANYFHHFSQEGINVVGNNNTIAGNRIGIAFDNTPIGSPFGIFISGSGNLIGGTGPGAGNIISGNDKGIGLYTLSGSTYIYGNKIGTDLAGMNAVGNKVGIDNIGPNVYIGNGTPGGMNIISGNTESGILMGTFAQNNFINGNHIGTDASGAIPVPNRDGITLGPGSFTTLIENNQISYNTKNGILISGIMTPELESDMHVIDGNEILANGNAGILLTGAANFNVIGSSLTGILPPNQIKFNGSAGILIAPGQSNPQQNTIRRNSFQDNTNYGIQIIAGQGNIQPPVLATYEDPGQGLSTITGTHPLAGAVIDIYDGDANQINVYEGLTWLGEGLVDPAGNFSISISSCDCDTIVATATDILGNTSEFSDGAGVITSLNDPLNELPLIKVAPNPFQDLVTIEFVNRQPGFVSLKIYDMSGVEIKTLIEDHLQSGIYMSTWNPENRTNGIYYYKLVTGINNVRTGKIISIQP